jgi:hypothetical protein
VEARCCNPGSKDDLSLGAGVEARRCNDLDALPPHLILPRDGVVHDLDACVYELRRRLVPLAVKPRPERHHVPESSQGQVEVARTPVARAEVRRLDGVVHYQDLTEGCGVRRQWQGQPRRTSSSALQQNYSRSLPGTPLHSSDG